MPVNTARFSQTRLPATGGTTISAAPSSSKARVRALGVMSVQGARAEQAARTHHEDQDHGQERDEVLIARRDDAGAEGLQQAEHQPADHGADGAAEAAEHG